MKLVLDSNIYIAGLAVEGITFEVMIAALSEHDVYVSQEILNEVAKGLRKKLKHPEAMVAERMRSIEARTEILRISGKVRGVSRDPKDDHVLELAERSEAELIITGDKDLLVLKSYKGSRIVTPREFLQILE